MYPHAEDARKRIKSRRVPYLQTAVGVTLVPMFIRTHLTVEEQLFVLIREAGERGITAKEATEALEGYHGPISGKLSYLHKTGEIFRLTEKRDNFKIYVHPAFCKGRTIERQGRQRNCPHCGEEI